MPFEVEVLLSIITFAVSLYLGFTVYARDTGSWTNRFFFALSLLIAVYIGVNFVSLHPPGGAPETQLFFVRLVMFVTSFIGPVLILFVHTFPRRKVTLQWKYIIGLLVLMCLSAYASITDLVFDGIEYPGGEPVPTPGAGIGIFLLDFVGLFILSFVLLFFKYRSASRDIRAQIKLLFWGTLGTFSLMGLSTVLFVVILETSAFVFFGPIFSLILMTVIAYAIVHHQFLNTKMIAAKLLVGIIWTLLFARLIATWGDYGVGVEVITLFSAVVFGIFLVRSVNREVKQREEIEELADELKEANERLRVLDQRKSEFISLASHQLRTPMTSIKGYASMLLEGTYGKIPEKMEKPLTYIFESSQRLVVMIADYLTISRIEQDRLEYQFQTTDLLEVVSTVVEGERQNAQQKGLKLTCDAAEPREWLVTADRQKLIQAVGNLVDNAIKYTEKGSVRVKLSTDKAANRYCITITDTGRGMDQKTQEKVFEKFTRGEEGVSAAVDGHGLGLYIAKRVIEGHRGTIGVTSEGEGKGTTFVIGLTVQE